MGRGLDQTSTKVCSILLEEKERNVKEEPNADKTRRKISRFNEVEQTLYAIFRVKETSTLTVRW